MGISKVLSRLLHNLRFPRLIDTYEKLLENQYRPQEVLINQQNIALQKAIEFNYQNVPYYKELLDNSRLKPSNFKEISDLNNLPVLTKEVINNQPEKFVPLNLTDINYSTRSTGGTSGTPLNYRISKKDRLLSIALLYRDLNRTGYQPGDRMIIFGGSSLIPDNPIPVRNSIAQIARNARFFDSFRMDKDTLLEYVNTINKFKPKIIYGYPSSINQLALWYQTQNISFPKIDAIFTTSEKLYPFMRKNIEEIFDTEVYDGYGLNDGGISASECELHHGYHISTERSLMEIVDEGGTQIDSGSGKILATSFLNKAFPFLRYDTGDLAVVESNSETYECGIGLPLIKEIIGRSVDMLVTPEGKLVHGWLFLYIFWEHNQGIKQYKVIQEDLENIVVKILPIDENNFDNKVLKIIENIILENSPNWKIKFIIVSEGELDVLTNAGKRKFIERKIELPNYVY